MKSGVTIFFVLFVLVAYLRHAENKLVSFPESREALIPVRNHCIERVHTDPKLIDNAVKGNFAADRKLECYYKCMMLNTKMMRNDKIVERLLYDLAEFAVVEESRTVFRKAVENCHALATKSMDGCKLAYEYVKCLYEYDPVIMFFP
ncbi:hypothetical protein PUN28_015086 [Cardiocondyla obscurior]|uniref:Uncharacterized protein n=1 Tax=Cardiocondyla obscurior TaxID=286306 RepID=A0AAW2F0T8_9HYME